MAYRIPLRNGTSQIPTIKSRKPKKLLTRVNVRENPVLMVTSFSLKNVADFSAKMPQNGLVKTNSISIEFFAGILWSSHKLFFAVFFLRKTALIIALTTLHFKWVMFDHPV